jgi:hypothetical protein
MDQRDALTDRERRELNRRLQRVGRDATRLRHAERVARWAMVGSGPFPLYADSEAEIGEELGLLLRALGPLALLGDPDLPAKWKLPERPERPQ